MRIIFLSLYISLFTLPSLFSDTIELENGDRITGTITQMNENTVTIKAPYGVLVIKRSFIKKGLFSTGVRVPRSGLLLEFLFAGNLADTALNHKAQNSGAAYGEGRDGAAASAISSDGSGKFAIIEKSEALDALDSFAVSFWFNIKNETKSQYMLSKWDSTNGSQANGKLAVLYKGGAVFCYIADASGEYHTVKSEPEADANEWHHLAVVCDCGKGTLALYLDCKKSGESKFASARLFRNTSPLYILSAKSQKDEQPGFYNTDGAMDSLRIYDRPLIQAEVSALYNEFSGG